MFNPASPGCGCSSPGASARTGGLIGLLIALL
jgi:MYXO-CTERM domain-containing protein